ncbi:MAG: helix-turn-helix domain-containing protein [Acidobacteriota bacterium]
MTWRRPCIPASGLISTAWHSPVSGWRTPRSCPFHPSIKQAPTAVMNIRHKTRTSYEVMSMDPLVCPVCECNSPRPAAALAALGRCRRCGANLFTLIEVPLADDPSRRNGLSIGAALKEIRKMRDQNQSTVGSCARIDRAHLSRIESGASAPHLQTLCRLLRALGVHAILLRVDAQPPHSS